MLQTMPVSKVKKIIQHHFGRFRMLGEKVNLFFARDRILSEDIFAPVFIPGFDRSSVDGYAVRSLDVINATSSNPVILHLIGQTVMGQHTALTIEQGQTVYVPTGGEVPIGTEAMVMLEHTDVINSTRILVRKPCILGENMILRGEDMKPGELVLPAGKRLKVADIGTLAAMGNINVPVHKRPRVGIISTGDEIVPVDQPQIQIGQVRDVNAPMLYQAILSAGGEPIDFGIVRDDINAIRTLVQKAIDECDLLLISGSTSLDKKDMASTIVEELGEVFIHGIQVKPGKPTIVGSIHSKPVFGLPGNPVSVYFTFHLFVRPLICSFLGTLAAERKITLPLAATAVTNHGREEYLPVFILDGFVHPIPWKSNLITRVSKADGYIVIPSDRNEVNVNELVEVTFLDS